MEIDLRTGVVEPSREGWLSLLARDPQATIYLHPEVATSRDRWYYARGRGDELSALAVLAPKELRVRLPGLRSGVVLRGRKVVGDRVLGAADDAEAKTFVAEMARLLASGAAECVLFEDLEVGSPIWRAAVKSERAGRLRVFSHPTPPQLHWWLRFPQPPEHYWQQHSSKTRNTLRRKLKKLPHALVRCTRPEDVPTFLARAEAVSRRSWQGQRLGVRLRNAARHRQQLVALARRGALRSYLLETGGRAVAFLLGVQDGGVFRYEEVGFDPALHKLSPGTVLFLEVLADLMAERCPEAIDFGLGDAGYKQMFATDKTLSGPLVLASRALRPTAAVAIDRLHRIADRGARYFLREAGLYEQVRRLYRRGVTQPGDGAT